MASAIGMVTGDQPDEEVVVIGFCDDEEGRNQWSNRGGLLHLSCNVWVGVLEGGEYIKDYFHCNALRSRSGVESVNQKIKEFHTIFAMSPAVETRLECI